MYAKSCFLSCDVFLCALESLCPLSYYVPLRYGKIFQRLLYLPGVIPLYFLNVRIK